jgi:hypothetical protein
LHGGVREVILQGVIRVSTAIGCLVLCGSAIAENSQIPRKIDRDQAEHLVDAVIGSLAELEFENDMGPPFLVFEWWPGDPVQGINGYYSVNPWTGDVWDFWTCDRLTTPALRKSQAKIRRSFTPTEMKQYARLHRLRPACLNDD